MIEHSRDRGGDLSNPSHSAPQVPRQAKSGNDRSATTPVVVVVINDLACRGTC